MFERWSLRFPITLGVTMIVLIIALIVGWILITVFNARSRGFASLNWTILSVGIVSLAMVLAGVIMYLTLSIKAINLSRRQSNFIDSVTHELKSPIASLKLYLQTLNLREVSEEERATFHRYMMDDVDRLDNLINHLLDAGAVVKGGDAEPVDTIRLHELIEQCVVSACSRYRVEPEIVELDLAACTIRGSRVSVMMIFSNLLDNAIKYSGDPPRVMVQLRLEGDRAVIEVSDNGSGIPADQRRKIFRRFVRLGQELQRKKPGTGLGLYIVRTLVKRLGGTVKVLDRERKAGTVFEVRLPADRLSDQSAIRTEVSRLSQSDDPE